MRRRKPGAWIPSGSRSTSWSGRSWSPARRRNECRRELLRNGEKYIAALSGAITVSAATTTVQRGLSHPGGRRRPFGASVPSAMNWVSYTNGWNPFAVKYMTLPRRFGINGQNLPFLPAELDAAEARTDQLYRLKKENMAPLWRT